MIHNMFFKYRYYHTNLNPNVFLEKLSAFPNHFGVTKEGKPMLIYKTSGGKYRINEKFFIEFQNDPQKNLKLSRKINFFGIFCIVSSMLSVLISITAFFSIFMGFDKTSGLVVCLSFLTAAISIIGIRTIFCQVLWRDIDKILKKLESFVQD